MSYRKMTRHLKAPGLKTVTDRTVCPRGGRNSGTEQYRKRITVHSKVRENNKAERLNYGEEPLERSRMTKITVVIRNVVGGLDCRTGVREE